MNDLDTGLGYLARRCTPRLAYIWTDRHMVELERDLWLCVMRHQVHYGIVADVMLWHQYNRAAPLIDLDAIRRRELVTRHDLKARIEEYNHQADPTGQLQLIHLGMTSADVVDNVTLIRIRESLQLLAAVHDLPGLAAPLASLPFRGIKGPVGTQQDMLDLYGGTQDAVDELDQRVARRFGFERVLGSIGQTYPRSLELCLTHLASEGVAPWSRLVVGYLGMLAGCAGDQWNEGDVSSSVTRRVALPGIFMATDIGIRASRESEHSDGQADSTGGARLQ